MSDIPVLDPAPEPGANKVVRRTRATRIKRAYRRRTPVDAARAGAASAGASERAEPAREAQSADAPVGRRRTRDERSVDKFALPKHRMKPGRDYQWWPFSVMAQLVDPSAMTEIYEGQWQEERARDWPELVLPGSSPDAVVDRLGQRLFGRPMIYTLDARREDYNAAEQQKLDRMRTAAEGRLNGNDQSLSQVSGVRAVPLQLEIEGEVGSYGGGRR